MVACDRGHTEIARRLLATVGINVWLGDRRQGETALHKAAKSGHVACVDLLLQFDPSLVRAVANHQLSVRPRSLAPLLPLPLMRSGCHSCRLIGVFHCPHRAQPSRVRGEAEVCSLRLVEAGSPLCCRARAKLASGRSRLPCRARRVELSRRSAPPHPPHRIGTDDAVNGIVLFDFLGRGRYWQ
jgi:hypothetical protein